MRLQIPISCLNAHAAFRSWQVHSPPLDWCHTMGHWLLWRALVLMLGLGLFSWQRVRQHDRAVILHG